jgi:hypothetical protein
MNVKLGWMRRRVLALAVAALCVVAISGTALAGHQTSGVKHYTGCLVSGDGVMIKIKEGVAPRSACTGGQVEAHFSGGDITRISVGSGLSLPNGGDNGEVRIVLDASHSLPQGCDDGEVAKWETSTDPDRWVCRADNDTTYAPGTGLDLSAGNAFSIEPSYRVKNTPDCPGGQFATGFGDTGNIQCAAPPTPAGVQAYSSTVGAMVLAGDNALVISKNVPAGTYLLFASVSLANQDANAGGDGYASVRCTIPGFQTGRLALVWPDEGQAHTGGSASLASSTAHAGGAIELRCSEESADVDILNATLTALKVDSLG